MDLRGWIVSEHAASSARFQSAVAAHVPGDRWRERPGDAGSSIAWLVFHTSWHQDLAVHAVVRGEAPVLHGWRGPLNLDAFDAEAGLGETEQVAVTTALDVDALQGYAATVHEASARWLAEMDLGRLDDIPDAAARMEAAGVSVEAVPWLHQMWSGQPVAWFVQWEAVGHVQGHLGEMISVRSRLGLSPF
jgi:DinB superfamily